MSKKENKLPNPWENPRNPEITPEDLTITLIKSKDDFLKAVLRELNFNSIEFLKLHEGNAPAEDATLSPESKRVLQQAVRESAVGSAYGLQDHHFLLGITHWERERAEKTAGLLLSWGISYQKAQSTIELLEEKIQRPPHIGYDGDHEPLGSDFISPGPEPGKPE